MFPPWASYLLLAAPLCLAQSSDVSASATQTLEPCGQISSLLASYAAALPSSTIPLFLDVQLAQDCYDSVPLDQNDATSLIDGLSAMLEFQSDLAFLINPPPGYLLAGVDLQGELSDLRDQVTSNNITGEMDFETRLETILARAHDGHLTYSIDGLSIFGLGRRTGSLVSVSLDAISTPKVYLYGDVVQFANGTGETPVAITEVNGLEVTDYILYLAQNTTSGNYQDPDTLYNAFFWAWNDGASVSNSAGLFPGFNQEPFELFTNVTFENGTTVSSPNFVLTASDFSSVTDGDSFYQSFLNQSVLTASVSASPSTISVETSIPTSVETSTATEPAPPTAATSIMGFPVPTVISSDGAFSGYFLDTPGFEDTAVMALRSMSETASLDFQASLTQFLDACRANNKQQLVIDVSGNGGGSVNLGYDLIKQLFPSIEPYGAGTYRATDAFRLLGETITNVSSEAEQQDPNNYTNFANVGGTSIYNSGVHLDVNNEHFLDFAAYFGPLTAPDNYGNYTNLTREDLNNVDYNSITGPVIVSGYGNNTYLAPQPFENSNVILISDGQCSSTCTIFSHFLKYQAKVKSIALGGRPTTGPMQPVGGVKGSQVQFLSTQLSLISFGISIADNETLSMWTGTPLETIYNYGSYLIGRTASKGAKPGEASFNIRNNIAEGDESLTPLQFIYEAADCRLFFQPKHYLDVTTIWTDAASQAFGLNGTEVFSGCVAGSTDQPSSLSGDPELYANGTIQNATVVEIGAGIANQTGGGEGGNVTGPGQYTGGAGVHRASVAVWFGAAIVALGLLL